MWLLAGATSSFAPLTTLLIFNRTLARGLVNSNIECTPCVCVCVRAHVWAFNWQSFLIFKDSTDHGWRYHAVISSRQSTKKPGERKTSGRIVVGDKQANTDTWFHVKWTKKKTITGQIYLIDFIFCCLLICCCWVKTFVAFPHFIFDFLVDYAVISSVHELSYQHL